MNIARVDLPAGVFRTDTVYRTLGGDALRGVVTAGFMLKGLDGRYYDEHRARHYSGLFILRGEGVYVDRAGREYPLRPGAFAQRFPDVPHVTFETTRGAWAEGFVGFGAGLAAELIRIGCLDPRRPVLYPGLDLIVVHEIEKIVVDLKTVQERELFDVLSRMLRIVSDVYALDARRAPGEQYREIVGKACRELAEDFEGRIALDVLARKYHMSYERFRKVFRDFVGVPPGEYRIRRRIDRARALIGRKTMTVAEVAEALGYPDAFTFSRQFRRFVGIPPSRYV